MSASQETEAPGQPSDKHLPAWSSYAPPPLQVTTSADFTLRNLSNRDFSPVNSLSPGLAINTVSPAPVSHRLTTSISSPYLTIPPYLPLSPKSAAFSPSFVARSHTSEDLSRPTWLAKQPSLLSISEVPSPSQPAESPADLDTPSQGQFSLPSIGHAHRTEDHTGQFRRSLTEESRSDQHRQTFPTDDVLVRPLATDGSRRAFDLDIDFSEVPMEGLRDEAVEGLRTQHCVWVQCREIQNKLESVCVRLHQAPGISPHVLNEMNNDIQQVGQLVNQAVMAIVNQWAELKFDAGQLKNTISNWNHAERAHKMNELERERDSLCSRVAQLENLIKEIQGDSEAEKETLGRVNLELRGRNTGYKERLENLQDEAKKLMNEFKKVAGVMSDRDLFENAKSELFQKICGQISNKESLFSLLDSVRTPPPNNDYHLLEDSYKAWKTKEILEKQKNEHSKQEYIGSEGQSEISEADYPPSTAIVPVEEPTKSNANIGALIRAQATPSAVPSGDPLPSAPYGRTGGPGGPGGPPGSGAGSSGPRAVNILGGYHSSNSANDLSTPTRSGPGGLGGREDSGGLGGHGFGSRGWPTYERSDPYGGNQTSGISHPHQRDSGQTRPVGIAPNTAQVGQSISQGNNGPPTRRSASAFHLEGTPSHVPMAVPPSPYPPGTRGPRRPSSVHPGRQAQFRVDADEFRPMPRDHRMVLYGTGSHGRHVGPQQFGQGRECGSNPAAMGNWYGPNTQGDNNNVQVYRRPPSRMLAHGPARFGPFGENNRDTGNPQMPTSHGAVIPNVEPAYQTFIQDVHGLFPELYGQIGGWVRSHCPFIDNRQMLLIKSSKTYKFLLGCYTPMSAPQAGSYVDIHLKEAVFRPCLLSRLLIGYFTRNLWNVSSGWIGYNRQTDTALGSVDHEMSRLHMMSGFQQQQVINRRADVVASITDAPDYEDFRGNRLAYFTGELENMLKPLASHPSQAAHLNADTRFVVNQAWEISRLIATSRVQWGFRWPHTGERFSPATMNSVYPQKDAQELFGQHWRVSLVISPIITITQDTGNRATSVHELHVSDVVCMQ